MNRRRRMMMGRKRVYVFKEGEGLVFGKAYLASDYHSEINNNYIHLEGRAWGSSTSDDDESFGMLISQEFIKSTSSWFEKGGAFDFSNYKTLNFEFEAETNDRYGYAGYCEDQRIFTVSLSHGGNGFSESKIRDLYRGGEYKKIAGTKRQIVSFDISGKNSGIIAMLSPHGSRHIRFFNIWLE